MVDKYHQRFKNNSNHHKSNIYLKNIIISIITNYNSAIYIDNTDRSILNFSRNLLWHIACVWVLVGYGVDDRRNVCHYSRTQPYADRPGLWNLSYIPPRTSVQQRYTWSSVSDRAASTVGPRSRHTQQLSRGQCLGRLYRTRLSVQYIDHRPEPIISEIDISRRTRSHGVVE